MRLALALPGLVLAACSSFDFRAQHAELRHVDAEDALALRLVYHELAPGTSSVEQAAETLARIADGRRQFVLHDAWLGSFDLERPLDPEEDEPAELHRLHEWLRRVEVRDVGLFRPASGSPWSAWQELRFPSAAEGVERLNAAISAYVLAENADDPARAASRAAASAGHAWVALERGTLRVSVPTTPERNADLARDLAEDGAALLAPLTSVVLGEELATFVYAPDASGWIGWRFDKEERGTARTRNALADALAERVEERPPPSWIEALIAR